MCDLNFVSISCSSISAARGLQLLTSTNLISKLDFQTATGEFFGWVINSSNDAQACRQTTGFFARNSAFKWKCYDYWVG